jgi:hypothetical protein
MVRCLLFILFLAGCVSTPPHKLQDGDYLFVWASDASARASDFLAVIDVNPRSPTYADIVASAPVGVAGTRAHHTEHIMPRGGILLANGFQAGRTFLFDLRDPLKPFVSGSFANAGDYMHAHSFARLPNGHVLATFQMRGHGNAAPGGLVELSTEGRVLRASSAADPDVEGSIRPYSLAVVPALDRVVTTSSDMHEADVSRVVQVWRLSDLSLIKSFKLPPGPRGRENEEPAEPRLLSDGRTVAVSSFNCGLFLIDGLEGRRPGAELVHSFPGAADKMKCGLPVVSGRYWIQSDASVPGLVSLDLSDPRHPVETGRLTLPGGHEPHWISLAPDGERIVISGGIGAGRMRVLIARIDRSTGKLSLDPSFRARDGSEPGISFDRAEWPHGATGPAVPHGAVFSREGR